MAQKKQGTTSHHFFGELANRSAKAMGSVAAFGIAIAIVATWAATGPVFDYSDTWQLVINTGTTIVTFLMVFLIQNTQNRDSAAIQLKLDELIRCNQSARNTMIDLQELTQEDLDKIQLLYKRVGERAREHDNSTPQERTQKKSGASGFSMGIDQVRHSGSRSPS